MICWEKKPINSGDPILAISLDLETMGFHSDGCLAEIGAVIFAPDTDTIVEEFHLYVDIVDAVKCGGKIYPEVVAWWAGLGYFQEKDKTYDVRHSLESLYVFLTKYPDLKIYGKHILFDLGILERLYLLQDLPIPWKYDQPYDLATLEGLFPKDALYSGEPPHNALQDARRQAAAIGKIYKFFSNLKSEE